MPDAFDLERFVTAQQPVLAQVQEELRGGRKRSHWMWFIFPQLSGLGHSATARYYAIGSRQEAIAYLAHPQLGPRLIACGELVNRIEGRSVEQIFGSPDDLKFRSCMTLFAALRPESTVFSGALARYFDGAPDPATIDRLGEP